MFDSSRFGTSAGGSGGGALSRLSRTHLPRSTGEVRVAYDDTARMLPCVSTPPRGVPVRSTWRNCWPRDVRDPVVPRQPLVQERVAAVDEVEHAAIVADDGLEEELGLAPHRQPEVVLELGELVAVAGERFERAELQPLAAEVLGERPCLRIAQHPPHLEGEDLRVAQRPGVGGAPQLGVRHARPEEVREPRRQLVRRDAVRRRRRGRRGRSRSSGRGSRARRAAPGCRRRGPPRTSPPPSARASVERDVLRDLARRDRTAERAARQVGHDARRAGGLMRAVEVTAGVDLLEARARWPLRVRVGSADLDGAHAHAVQRNLRELGLRLVEPLAQLFEPLRRRVGRRRELGGSSGRVEGWDRRSAPAALRRCAGWRPRSSDRRPSAGPSSGRPDRRSPAGRPRTTRRPPDRASRSAPASRPPRARWSPASDAFGRRPPSTTRTMYSPSTGMRCMEWKAFGRLSPVTSYDAGIVRVSMTRRPSERSRTSVGSIAGGPKSATPRDAIRRRHVLLHQHRRQRQHVGDVVEPVPGIVLREVVCRPDVDAEQFLDRVVVLGAVEAARGDPARIGRRSRVDALQLARQPRRDGLALLLGRLLLFERRHLAAAQLADDLVPLVAMFDERRARARTTGG